MLQKDSSILGCDNELLCERLPTMETCKAFRMSKTTHSLQQHHIPDDKNLHAVRLWECLHSMTASYPTTMNLYKQPATSILHNQLSVPHISLYINNANLRSNVEINFSLWTELHLSSCSNNDDNKKTLGVSLSDQVSHTLCCQVVRSLWGACSYTLVTMEGIVIYFDYCQQYSIIG